MQNELLNDCKVDQTTFWKSIGKIGVGQVKHRQIPMEVVLDNGDISNKIEDVLGKWKAEYSALFSNKRIKNDTVHVNTLPCANVRRGNVPGQGDSVDVFNDGFSILEIKKAIDDAKYGKAFGIDEIPAEVIKNDVSVMFLHVLFNV